MYATREILQVHPPKTGGTWLTHVLAQELGGDSTIAGQHDPAWYIPEKHRRNRVVISTVRDPWSHAVSLWAHAAGNDDATHERMRVYGGGSIEFRDVLHGMCFPNEVPTHEGLIWKASKHWRVPLETAGMGLFSWATRYFNAGGPDGSTWGVDILLDTAQLATATAAILGVPIYDLDEYAPMNTRAQRGAARLTGPEALADWYDDESLGWVRDRERWLIDLMGYPGPGAPAALPCLAMTHRGAEWLARHRARPAPLEAPCLA